MICPLTRAAAGGSGVGEGVTVGGMGVAVVGAGAGADGAAAAGAAIVASSGAGAGGAAFLVPHPIERIPTSRAAISVGRTVKKSLLIDAFIIPKGEVIARIGPDG